jgi:hypothetical protein
MSGEFQLNLPVPEAAPDWRSLAPSARPYDTPQLRMRRDERDWLFWLVYSAGLKPGTVMRRLAEGYANGASIPFIPELGEPKRKRRLIEPSEMVIHSFPLELETARRAYARARTEGYSLSAIMRRFVVDYVRRERAARASEATPVQPQPKRMKGDHAV